MGIDFTVITGSPSGALRTATGHRDVGPTQALVKITHSGVCGTDEHYRSAGIGLGHEGVGVITELGHEAAQGGDFKVGDRVGMGWMQKYCGRCRSCLKGESLHEGEQRPRGGMGCGLWGCGERERES
jgi:D-arabinose 1-dehydrogenase-like Zn-dependent alcohol dehydrogenase